MPNHHIPRFNPNSPAPPPSPVPPICSFLLSSSWWDSISSTSRHRGKSRATAKKQKKPRLEISDENLAEFYRTHGVDGSRIHNLLGNPYSNGLTAWRLLEERWSKEGLRLAMMPIKERELGSWAQKHRSRSLEGLVCNRHQALFLRNQVISAKLQSTITTAKKEKKPGLEEILVEFYRTHGADGSRIHHLLGSPYSNGVTAWRLLEEWWRKEGLRLAMMLIKEREMGYWAQKHRPRSLEDFVCHREQALFLRNQVAQGVDGHFIFEGPPGVGKKTMICAFLREVFGPDVLNTKEESKVFELKGEEMASITVNVLVSPHHIEINISELNGYLKHVITSLVEETHIIATECNQSDSRAIVLYQADELCLDIQDYIRWIMERHQKCHKFLFCCSDISNLAGVSSICRVVQLLPPSNDELLTLGYKDRKWAKVFDFMCPKGPARRCIYGDAFWPKNSKRFCKGKEETHLLGLTVIEVKIIKVVVHIANKEGIQIHESIAQTIANNSRNNLQHAIQLLESSSQVKHNSHQIISV